MAKKPSWSRPLFADLEVGQYVRWESLGGFEKDGVWGYYFCSWIYGIFRGYDKEGWPLVSVMDKLGSLEQWGKMSPQLTGEIELWDYENHDTSLERALPVYIRNTDEKCRVPRLPENYDYAGVTLGQLEGSEWINRWTHDHAGPCYLGLDRWGELQLQYDDPGCIGYTQHIGHAAKLAGTDKTVFIVSNSVRWDTMEQGERVRRARLRLDYCQNRLKEHGGDEWCRKEMAKAIEFWREVTGDQLPPHEHLNCGTLEEGQQLALL